MWINGFDADMATLSWHLNVSRRVNAKKKKITIIVDSKQYGNAMEMQLHACFPIRLPKQSCSKWFKSIKLLQKKSSVSVIVSHTKVMRLCGNTCAALWGCAAWRLQGTAEKQRLYVAGLKSHRSGGGGGGDQKNPQTMTHMQQFMKEGPTMLTALRTYWKQSIICIWLLRNPALKSWNTMWQCILNHGICIQKM